jgi:tRNA(Arg) A34 adenosine deaminase TadA
MQMLNPRILVPLAVLASRTFVLAAAPATPAVTPLSDDPACTDVDRKFMAHAIELVRDSVAKGWHPFSAILVKDGQVLAEYQNSEDTTHDVTKHAETGLISMISPKLDRATLATCTLYTSTEPCTMCCGAIRFAGIGRIVYGVTEAQMYLVMGLPAHANPLASREVFARTAPYVKVLGPLMEAEGLPLHVQYWSQHPLSIIPHP